MWDAKIVARIATGMLELEEKSSAEEKDLEESLRLEITAVRITSNEDEIGDLAKKLVVDLDYNRTDSKGQRMFTIERLIGHKT
jgi:hypothetical protein